MGIPTLKAKTSLCNYLIYILPFWCLYFCFWYLRLKVESDLRLKLGYLFVGLVFFFNVFCCICFFQLQLAPLPKKVPKTAENFRQLCTGEHEGCSPTELGRAMQKVCFTQGWNQEGGDHQWQRRKVKIWKHIFSQKWAGKVFAPTSLQENVGCYVGIRLNFLCVDVIYCTFYLIWLA